MFCRIHAPHLDGIPLPVNPGAPGWRRVALRFRGVPATRPLLTFGVDVEILTPPEVRADLTATAATAATAAAALHDAPVA